MAANSSMERLKELYLCEHYKRFPNFPGYAKTTPPYKPKTANGLTRMINDWLNLSGWQSERISNTGRLIDNRKIVTDCIGRQRMIGSSRWIPGTGTNGTADISATVAGRSVKIEIKIGRDRQSEAQKEYQRQIEAAGGIYIIVRKFDEFLQWYDHFFGYSKNLMEFKFTKIEQYINTETVKIQKPSCFSQYRLYSSICIFMFSTVGTGN